MAEIPVFMLSRKSAKSRRASAVVRDNTGQARTEREAEMIEPLVPPIGQDTPAGQERSPDRTG